MWHVQGVPEIGFQFSLKPVIDQFDPRHLEPAFQHSAALHGATIVQVGDRPVQTWPQLVRSLENLEQETFLERDSLGSADSNYARFEGAEWVRVRAQPADGSPAFSVWCRVSRPGPVAVLPLILWFGMEMAVFLVAAFVWWNRPNDRASRLFFLMTLTVVAAFIGGFHWSRIATQPLLLVVYIVSAVLLPAVSLHFYQVFPRPKPWFDAHPIRSLGLTYGPSLLFLAALLIGYGWIRRWTPQCG
jgi:hypothetical protein